MSIAKHDSSVVEVFRQDRSQNGILSMIPAPLMPYIELSRLHKPIAITHIYVPYMFGCLYAACVSDTVTTSQLIWACTTTLITGVILRSVGCAWNDIVDRDFDAVTERCRNRPMARGAIPVTRAYAFCAVLWLLWSQVLYQTGTIYAVLYAIPVPILTTVYPYTKRFTHYPQVVLGVTLSLGCFVGSAQLNEPLHVLLATKVDLDSGFGLVALFLVYVVWTVIYDTVYAFQDLDDDVESGVLSLAVLFANRPSLFLSVASAMQLICLLGTGYLSGLGIGYYLVTCGGIGVLLCAMLLRLDVKDTRSCLQWFKHGALVFDAFVILGLGWEFASRR